MIRRIIPVLTLLFMLVSQNVPWLYPDLQLKEDNIVNSKGKLGKMGFIMWKCCLNPQGILGFALITLFVKPL